MSDASDQTGPGADDDALAAEYALGLLSAKDAAAFEARLNREPALRACYADWAAHFAQMTDDLPQTPPPARVWHGVEDALFAPRRSQPRWPWLAGLVGLAAVAGLALLLLRPAVVPLPQPPGAPALVAEILSEDSTLRVAAAYDAGQGTLYLDRGTAQPAPGRDFELWLIQGEAAPVSLGVLPEAARAVLPVPAALRAQLAGGVLAISDEPRGGSPTGQVTGPVLAVGPLTGA